MPAERIRLTLDFDIEPTLDDAPIEQVTRAVPLVLRALIDDCDLYPTTYKVTSTEPVLEARLAHAERILQDMADQDYRGPEPADRRAARGYFEAHDGALR